MGDAAISDLSMHYLLCYKCILRVYSDILTIFVKIRELLRFGSDFTEFNMATAAMSNFGHLQFFVAQTCFKLNSYHFYQV